MSIDEKNIHENTEDSEMEEHIRQRSEDVPIPEGLKPENIEKVLNETKTKKRTGWKTIYGVVAAAACCVLVVGITVWNSAGGNTVSSLKTTSATDSDTTEDKKIASAEDEKIASAKDYDEIFAYIEAEKESISNLTSGNEIQSFESKEDSTAKSAQNTDSSAASGMQTGAAEGASYSDTNTREAGVEEGDIVKTDGKNLYILNNQKIQIVNIESDEMKELGTIRVDEGQYIAEIYVKDGKLIAVYTRTDYTDGKEGYGGIYKTYTIAETFDISNPEKPKSIGKLTQSGDFNTLRVTDEHVYLLSNLYVNMDDVKRAVEDSYIPEVQGKLLESSSILLPEYAQGSQYTVISSFSLKNPGEKTDSKAVFGSSGLVYVSGKNIYVCESYYNSNESDVTETCIRKVSYESGKLQAVGQTRIDGTLNDSFSIDEYEGNLRLVTTVSSTGGGSAFPIVTFGTRPAGEVAEDSNVLYVLDKDLNELGKIEGLAVGEQVYSARFMGDIGYFVTFKQVDPLFSVDLSDPKNPEILGALKIPGFSEYLHPYGENLLLGIGMDVDETGTTTNGVKLSMFDTSDPADVKEVQKYVLKDIYSTDVFYNYRAVLVSEEKNLFGFAASGDVQHYYLFSYDKEKGFQTVFDKEMGHGQSARGLYVGETFYIVAGNTVESYIMDKFEKVDDIVL